MEVCVFKVDGGEVWFGLRFELESFSCEISIHLSITENEFIGSFRG